MDFHDCEDDFGPSGYAAQVKDQHERSLLAEPPPMDTQNNSQDEQEVTQRERSEEEASTEEQPAEEQPAEEESTEITYANDVVDNTCQNCSANRQQVTTGTSSVRNDGQQSTSVSASGCRECTVHCV